jgi:exosortase/archaeosortase family protein
VYLYAVKHGDWRVNAAVIASLIPIAVFANLLRVGLLVLITHYFGFEAGQGFLHDGAGLFMFAVALGCVFLVDIVALTAFRRRGAP